MENINILLSVNKKFLKHTEELLASLLYYSSKKLNVYLMYVENELTQEDLNNVKNFVDNMGNGKIIPIVFDTKQLEGMPVTDDEGSFFGMEAYSRLFCSFTLPKEVEKILYFDADMICTGDITELYNIDFEGKMWIACRDKGIKQKDLDRLGLPSDYPYINSGMLLINVKKIRKMYTEQDIAQKIREVHKVLVYPDQDFINKVFCDDIKIVDNKYNLVAKDIRYNELTEKPLIIHYAGSVKPWKEDVSRFDKEYIEFYYDSMKLQGKLKEKKLKEIIETHKKYGYKN